MIVQLALPKAEIRLRKNDDGRVSVFDPLRDKWLILTPEEWVRQNFTSYLINHRGYPKHMIANEVSLTLNGLRRRCDTVVYDRNGVSPMVIVEYKAPSVAISSRTFDQIARYNMALCVRCLVVSNGLHHYCCIPDYENHSYRFVSEVPLYSELADL